MQSDVKMAKEAVEYLLRKMKECDEEAEAALLGPPREQLWRRADALARRSAYVDAWGAIAHKLGELGEY